MMKISVVTVCFNAAAQLPSTINSVLAQDFDDYEYIIQDGESTDDTADIVGSYREKFAARNIKLTYNREKDGGIYDAMNKAAASCKGEYINFMNAGDCFYSADVLSKAATAAHDATHDGKGPGLVYGDCAVYEYGMFFLFQKKPDMIEEMMPFSHQSVFARADLLTKHPFDTGYRYSADYDFLLKVHDDKETMADAGCVVCITTADGTSSVNYHDTLMETAAIQKAHGVLRCTGAGLAGKEKELRIKQFVMDHFPVAVKKYIRSRQISARGQGFEPVIPPWFDKGKG